MFRLLDLPSELLHLVLSHLAHISIRSLFASRLTCKLFETNTQLILKHEIANLDCATHSLLQTHFPTILNSSAIPAIRYPGRYDRHAPLRHLPWATSPKTRERWLRPEATWRRLPLASASGTIMRKMQVVCIPDRDREGRVSVEVEEIQGYCEVNEKCVLLIAWQSEYVPKVLLEDGGDAWVPEVVDDDHAKTMTF